VPKLDEAGTNWVIYQDRFLWSIDALGNADHINCSSPAHADTVTCTDTVDAPQTLTPAEAVLDVEWRKVLRIGKQEEAIVKPQIAVTISDSQFMDIRSKATAHEIWKALPRRGL
jgi:hypothetical protein